MKYVKLEVCLELGNNFLLASTICSHVEIIEISQLLHDPQGCLC